MPQPEVAACPEDGAVLIVSRHASEEAVAPAVVGWQVMRVLATGEHLEVGEVHPRRMDARQCAEARFTNIVGWQKLSATVFAAVVPASKAPPPAAPAPKPRRRANGLRIPLWRT
ncbi:MAG TPA: hypothetical protein VMF13_23070 [Luteitalea sp.]|nr:hypothetical protein [Luteitalea sp.]